VAGQRGTLEQRFWSKVIKQEGCWRWTANKHKGYGMIRLGGTQPKVAASRVSWIIHFGGIPDNLHVLHRCDNPECTNPEHLFLGTHADNMRDKEEKQRARPEGWLESCKESARRRKRLTHAQEANIRNLHAAGASIHGLSRMYEVDRNQIRAALRHD
jgi:hypothetical protein